MPSKPPPSTAAALRRRAEDRLLERHPDTDPARTEADMLRLFHELQVHQIELEMQNDELRLANEQAETEREKYSDLYDFAPVGYLTLDREGIIAETNLTGTALLGTERSRLLKRRFGLFVAAADRPVFNGFLQRVFTGQSKESCEVSLLKEGQPLVHVRLEAVVAASGRECRTVVTDITDQRRAEEDRLVLSKLESTGILAGGIAHDFNNLLTVIILNLDAGRELIPSWERAVQHLDEATKAALSARSLTQQLITFARGGASVRKPTALAAVIRESARLALSGSHVRCEHALADDLWPVEVDAGQIGQVLRNLVLNAREAMSEAGVVTIRAENVVLDGKGQPALPAGEYIRVSVADRGGGIAKEISPRIFDPYFSTKQRGDQKGMGLGLTICHSVVQKHGGAISVESMVGVGTTFHIWLPASRKPVAPEPAPAPKTLPRTGRILLMDDEEVLRDIFGATLRRMGHEVELAADGRRAVEAYSSALGPGRPFDMVILDLTVRGGMGGREAMKALLEIDPDVKAIVMSGYANDPVLLEHARHGFKGALAKPFDVGEMQELVARILGS